MHDSNAWVDPFGLDEVINWTSHGFKHFPQKNKSWTEIVKSTKNGPAKYIPEINIENLERTIWSKGTLVTNGKNWKVMEFDNIIGASEGKVTNFVRVENSGNRIHGHPISESEFKKFTKCK